MGNESEFVNLIGEISAKSDELVRGCIIGLLDAMTIAPSGCITVTPVKDVKAENDILMTGYVFTVLTSSADIGLPFEEACKKAILQRFVGEENGHFTKYLKYGDQQQVGSPYVN